MSKEPTQKQKDFSNGTAYEDLACPECGSPMEIVFSNRFRYRNGTPRIFYRCYKHPECKGSHGAHPNGAPLGKPANKETRDLRRKLHEQLDKKFPWKFKRGRIQTGSWLKKNNFGDGHVAHMNADECRSALQILRDDVK